MRYRHKLRRATRLLNQRDNILIYTGAGLSTASGLPTFDSRDGDSIDDWGYDRYVSDPEWRAEVATLIDTHRDVQPNAGHEAIQRLTTTRRAAHVSTNVDGLDPEALELCGSARRTVSDPLTGLLRPDVVFVGEGFDSAVMDEYQALIEQMDALLIVGASPLIGLWMPAVEYAHDHGLPVVNINARPERIWRRAADVTVRAEADRALPDLVGRLT